MHCPWTCSLAQLRLCLLSRQAHARLQICGTWRSAVHTLKLSSRSLVGRSMCCVRRARHRARRRARGWGSAKRVQQQTSQPDNVAEPTRRHRRGPRSSALLAAHSYRVPLHGRSAWLRCLRLEAQLHTLTGPSVSRRHRCKVGSIVAIAHRAQCVQAREDFETRLCGHQVRAPGLTRRPDCVRSMPN